MSKPVKDLMTREYAGQYDKLNSACVVSVIGMDAISTNKLRGELRTRKLRLQVIKNSLFRRALASDPLAPLGAALEGPCALVTGGDSIIDVAKTLVELQKTYPKIELKQAILDGDPDLIDVECLAQMKSRSELIADIAGQIASPGRRVAACLASPGGRIAGCIKTFIEKQEEQAAPEEAAAA